jgi:multidrug efflux system membrane fusion protein
MKPIFQPAFLCSLVCLLFAAGGCSEKKEDRTPAVPPVQIFTLPEADAAPFRSLPGEVTAQDNVRLSFDVAGRLVEFPVYNGKVVSQGDLIGQLDQGDFRATLDAAQATFTAAQQEFERNRTLRQRNVIAQNELDRHREAFERADAALRTARKAFEDTRLFAPIKGRISQRFVRNFQNVQAREPVVLLQNIETLEVDVQVPESLMAAGARDMTAARAHELVEAGVEFAAVPGERFPLTLRSFATQANPSSRTFLVSFRFRPPQDRNILPGMTCTVFLRFRHADGTPVVPPGLFEIPVRALATAEGRSFVWRWDAATGRVARVPVEIGPLIGETIQVRSEELRPGDELVFSGVRFLSEGMTVRRLETRQP